MISRHLNLLLSAAENVARSAGGYAVAATGLVVALTLMLAGVAISEGLKASASESVMSGADVYCTWDTFGRDTAVPRSRLEVLRDIDGVTRVVPRIIGRISLGNEYAILVGVPFGDFSKHPVQVDGRLPQSGAEVLVGHELARMRGLSPGQTIALQADSSRLFTISGIVSSTSSLWSAKAVVTDIAEAAILFGEQESVGDVCLYTRAGYAGLVADKVRKLDRRFRVQTKSLVAGYVARGMTIREGVFSVLWAVVLAVAIPSFAMMTYLGHTPRRRDIGLLKAEGWRTVDVLEMVALENVVVSILAASLALLLALIWVRLLRAPLIAGFFIAELPLFPGMTIPSRFLPLPFLVSIMFSIGVTMTGSIYATWRTAVTKPVDALR